MNRKLAGYLDRVLPRKLRYCDVGGRGGLEVPWSYFREVVEVIGFEPDPEELALMQRRSRAGDVLLPFALDRGAGQRELYLTRSRGCSSLFRPNLDLLRSFPEAERYEIEEVVPAVTISLDELLREHSVPVPDFLKVDAQGAELNILQGAESFLRSHALGLQVEVEFQPLYIGQPLFPEVDAFIRPLGFQIQDMRYTYWKYSAGKRLGGSKGQLIFGDVLYFRSPGGLLEWCARLPLAEAREKLQLTCLTALVYGYLDYCLHILEHPDVREILPAETNAAWKGIIEKYGYSHAFHGPLARRMGQVFRLLYRAFPPDDHAWASVGEHLGVRKRYGLFY